MFVKLRATRWVSKGYQFDTHFWNRIDTHLGNAKGTSLIHTTMIKIRSVYFYLRYYEYN